MACWWYNWYSMSHFLLSSDSSSYFLTYYFIKSSQVFKVFSTSQILLFSSNEKEKQRQLKYLHVLDIILLSNLHWFNSLGFKTSSINLWKECRGFNWLQWRFCLLKYSRAGSKENKIKSYWITNIYIDQWKGIGITVHSLKPFRLWCPLPSQSYHLAVLREEIQSVYCRDQRRDSSLTFINNSVFFKLLRGFRRQAHI